MAQYRLKLSSNYKQSRSENQAIFKEFMPFPAKTAPI
jgi:hypothetical protein